MILDVHILCEGSAVDRFVFCISLCVIWCYVDIFQCQETQCNLFRLCNQILFIDVFYLKFWRIDQVHSFFLSRSRIYYRCIWNMIMIFLLLMDISIFAQNAPWIYLLKMVHRLFPLHIPWFVESFLIWM